MVDRTIKQYKNKTARIVIIDPHINRRRQELERKIVEEEEKSERSTPRKSIQINIDYEVGQV